MAQAKSFLKNRNIQDKIILASTILSQQPEINFEASDISELYLTPSELYDAVAVMLSDPKVVVVPTAHSSNVNVMTTKEPPSFHGVITTSNVQQLARYSNVLGTEHINLRSLVDKAAISINDMHLSARGTLCGFKKPTDYERWIDFDHRRISEFMTILFGDAQTDWTSRLTYTPSSLNSTSDLKIGIVWVIFGTLSKNSEFSLNSLSVLTMILILRIKLSQGY
jgi:hypothetical protein